MGKERSLTLIQIQGHVSSFSLYHTRIPEFEDRRLFKQEEFGYNMGVSETNGRIICAARRSSFQPVYTSYWQADPFAVRANYKSNAHMPLGSLSDEHAADRLVCTL